MVYCSEADPSFQSPHHSETLEEEQMGTSSSHTCPAKKVQAEVCGTISILGCYLGGLSPHSVPSLLFLEGLGPPHFADLRLTPSEKSPPIPESPEEEVREASNISALEPFLTGVEVLSGLGLYVTPTVLR